MLAKEEESKGDTKFKIYKEKKLFRAFISSTRSSLADLRQQSKLEKNFCFVCDGDEVPKEGESSFEATVCLEEGNKIFTKRFSQQENEAETLQNDAFVRCSLSEQQILTKRSNIDVSQF